MIRRRSTFFLGLFCALLPVPYSLAQKEIVPKTAPPTVPSSTKPMSTIPPAANHALTPTDLETFFDGIIPTQLERSDIAGATVLILKDGQVLLKKGYGYSDLEKKKLVDPDTSMFRLASISKLFAWTSVMQLAEQGKLDIDADINKYLDFQIAPAFGKPVTLRNLMTHTGGFEEEVRDILLTDASQAPTLRDFLIANQPRRIFPPGQISAYSNYGVGLAGYIVQRVSGEPYEQYVANHIFTPLGMTHSSFHQPLEAAHVPLVSEGYGSSTDKPVVGFEIFNPAPAGGVSSSAADMGRFAQALLNGGTLDSDSAVSRGARPAQRILKPETIKLMWTRQFAASDALPAMCMGFYQTWRNGLHFIGHDGDLIAFHSMFHLEPKENLVIFVSYNSAGSAGKARGEILNFVADRYYPYTSNPEFQKLPLRELKEIEGTYHSTRRSESNKLKLADLASQFTAKVDKDGVLKVEVSKDLRGHVRKWRPLGKDLWQVDGDQPRIFAIRDERGNIVRVASNFGGSQLERVMWYENSKLISPLVLSSLAILMAVVIATLQRLGRRLFLSRRPPLYEQPGTLWLTSGPRVASFVWVALAVTLAIILSIIDNDSVPPAHTFDKYFVFLNIFTFIAILLSLFAVVSGLLIWPRSGLRLITKIKFSLVAVSCIFLVWFSLHWHLLGPAYHY